MNYASVLLLVVVSLLSGCVPAPPPVLSGAPAPLLVRQGDVTLSAVPPDGWRGFLDGTHLILTHQQDDDSLVVNLWMPEEDLIDTPADDSGARTAAVLQQITRSPQHIGNARASLPQPFQWMDYDGAYYVLTSDSDRATLVIALTPPETTQMIVINISGSEAALNSLQRTVGAVLDQVMVNQQPLGAELLALLPQPLELPTPQGMMTRP